MQRALPFPVVTAGQLLVSGIECDRQWARAFIAMARRRREAGDRRIAAWALDAAARHTRWAIKGEVR